MGLKELFTHLSQKSPGCLIFPQSVGRQYPMHQTFLLPSLGGPGPVSGALKRKGIWSLIGWMACVHVCTHVHVCARVVCVCKYMRASQCFVMGEVGGINTAPQDDSTCLSGSVSFSRPGLQRTDSWCPERLLFSFKNP